MACVSLAIGSNVERRRNIIAALEALRIRYGELTVSPVYESASSVTGEPDYWNLVVRFSTTQTVPSLVATLKSIEAELGRTPGGDRVDIDLDLLLYGDLVAPRAEIPVPHPEVLTRHYVLAPLAAIAPRECHPIVQQTYARLWQTMAVDAAPLKDVSALLDGECC